MPRKIPLPLWYLFLVALCAMGSSTDGENFILFPLAVMALTWPWSLIFILTQPKAEMMTVPIIVASALVNASLIYVLLRARTALKKRT
jgi:hypothetical protein